MKAKSDGKSDDPPKRHPSISTSRCLFGQPDHNQNRRDFCDIMKLLKGGAAVSGNKFASRVSDSVVCGSQRFRRRSSLDEIEMSTHEDDVFASPAVPGRSNSEPGCLPSENFERLPIETLKAANFPSESFNPVSLPTDSFRPANFPSESFNPVSLPTDSFRPANFPSEPFKRMEGIIVPSSGTPPEAAHFIPSYRTVPVVHITGETDQSIGSPLNTIIRNQTTDIHCWFTPISFDDRSRSLSLDEGGAYDDADLEVNAAASHMASYDVLNDQSTFDDVGVLCSSANEEDDSDASLKIDSKSFNGRSCRPKVQKLMTDFCSVKKFTRVAHRRKKKR